MGIMEIIDTPIAGVKIIETEPRTDERGSFGRWFCAQELAPALGKRSIVQINHSKTVNVGTIRGMHYQKPPHAEMKFVRCMKGKVWDIAIDIRTGSPTFLQWVAAELSPESGRMLCIPEGCAHGFQVLEANSELLYLHTAFYEPNSEGGIHHADPQISIPWPLPVTHISKRDAEYPFLTAFGGI
jgi:dTDP-4-dehydrorhamnose 3,5-epimerase